METFIEAAKRHEMLADGVMAEAERIKANAPAGADGREMRELASDLRSRSRRLRTAAQTLSTLENRLQNDTGGRFVGVDFSGLDWSSLNLNYGTFEDCTFSGAQFMDVVFGATFVGCRFDGCAFDHCSVGATFEGCNVSRAVFAATNLWHACFIGCHIEGADFTQAFRSRPYYALGDAVNDGLFNCTGTAIGLDAIRWGDVAVGSRETYWASRND